MLPRPLSKLSLASLPTPIRKLNRLSDQIGSANIWVKEDYLTGFTLSGNKVRKLEYLLADALQLGATDIITCGGIQSNHCRATAFACAQLGLRCHLILRDDRGYHGASTEWQGNHFLDFMAGAQVQLHEAANYIRNLDDLFTQTEQQISHEGRRAYSIPTGGSNGLGVWGYIDCIEEIKAQCAQQGFSPDLIVCASGSGGTQAGLVLGNHIHQLNSNIHAFAVCDSEAYFTQKVKDDIHACCLASSLSEHEVSALVQSLDIVTNDAYIGPGYAKAGEDVYECLRHISSLEGLLLDPVYTGKAFFGMLSELEKGRFPDAKNIVFMHTGGGFGIFPHSAYYADRTELGH